MNQSNIPYKRIYKRIYNPLRNMQTKKLMHIHIGGAPKIKKKYSIPSSTEKMYNPSRYMASTKTKKTREGRAQREGESHVAHKLYDYKKLQKKITEYNTKKEEVKSKLTAEGKSTKEYKSNDTLKKLKKEIRQLGNIKPEIKIDSNYIERISKQVNKSVAKYENKQKYYEDATDKLKHDSVDFMKNRTEYIKNGKPELSKKLESLATHDHTKMAFITLPGVKPKPVNKLKYSDFDNNPKVTNAYLDQFKTVNDSITKINKDFNINALSATSKVELAKELHKITKNGILDPNAQEQHFLKAVTDIAYKDKYYSTLSSKSKSAANNYIKSSGLYKEPITEPPELNLKQQKVALEQRLRKSDSLTVDEKIKLNTEIGNLDKQLKQSPEGLDKQIRAQETQLRNMSRFDPKYAEMSLALDRLKEHRENIDIMQKADFAEDTKLISSELAKLKEKRIMGNFATTNMNIPIDTVRHGNASAFTPISVSDTLKKKLADLDAKSKLIQLKQNLSLQNAESSTNINKTPQNNLKKQRKQNKLAKQIANIEANKQHVLAQIQKHEHAKQLQNTITELAHMTPEIREKFKDDLQGKSKDELTTMHKNMEAKLSNFKDNPALQKVMQRNIEQVKAVIRVEDFKQQVDGNPNLIGAQKEYIKQLITPDMTPEDIGQLTTKVISDKELNFRFVKQIADKKAANTMSERINAKQALINAKQARKINLNSKSLLARVSSKLSGTPESITQLKKEATATKHYSEDVKQSAQLISSAVADGKMTPKKAKQLLHIFTTRHSGYLPPESMELLRQIANQKQPKNHIYTKAAINKSPPPGRPPPPKRQNRPLPPIPQNRPLPPLSPPDMPQNISSNYDTPKGPSIQHTYNIPKPRINQPNANSTYMTIDELKKEEPEYMTIGNY